MDMYKVSRDIVKLGITLQNRLKYRIATAASRVIRSHSDASHIRRQDNRHRSKVRGWAVTVAQTRESAENVLSASQTVEAAAAELRREAEGFLSRVAA
jgi:hypothetical protein